MYGNDFGKSCDFCAARNREYSPKPAQSVIFFNQDLTWQYRACFQYFCPHLLSLFDNLQHISLYISHVLIVFSRRDQLIESRRYFLILGISEPTFVDKGCNFNIWKPTLCIATICIYIWCTETWFWDRKGTWISTFLTFPLDTIPE